MIVIDTSAVLQLVLAARLGDTVDQRVLRRGETLHAPYLIDIEAASALRRYARSGAATVEHCRLALDNLGEPSDSAVFAHHPAAAHLGAPPQPIGL